MTDFIEAVKDFLAECQADAIAKEDYQTLEICEHLYNLVHGAANRDELLDAYRTVNASLFREIDSLKNSSGA